MSNKTLHNWGKYFYAIVVTLLAALCALIYSIDNFLITQILILVYWLFFIASLPVHTWWKIYETNNVKKLTLSLHFILQVIAVYLLGLLAPSLTVSYLDKVPGSDAIASIFFYFGIYISIGVVAFFSLAPGAFFISNKNSSLKKYSWVALLIPLLIIYVIYDLITGDFIADLYVKTVLYIRNW